VVHPAAAEVGEAEGVGKVDFISESYTNDEHSLLLTILAI
jgi:hypothetical protein